jgi:hypothetical protein
MVSGESSISFNTHPFCLCGWLHTFQSTVHLRCLVLGTLVFDKFRCSLASPPKLLRGSKVPKHRRSIDIDTTRSRRISTLTVVRERLTTSIFSIENAIATAVSSAPFTDPAPLSFSKAGHNLSDGDKTKLRKIDDVALRTLRNCMLTVYEDGPRRDMRLWRVYSA